MPVFDCTADTAQLLVIDVQDRFCKAIPSIAEDGSCTAALTKLIKGCELMSVPITFSEQYPEGLGRTVTWLQDLTPTAACLPKNHFSCGDDEPLREHLAQLDRETVIIAGIEAHVCVLSTAADLLQRGYQVVVAADAIDSRLAENRTLAIDTMRQLGALVVPTETVLFRLHRRSDSPSFKELSRLVR